MLLTNYLVLDGFFPEGFVIFNLFLHIQQTVFGNMLGIMSINPNSLSF